jgi:hypothetical protein
MPDVFFAQRDPTKVMAEAGGGAAAGPAVIAAPMEEAQAGDAKDAEIRRLRADVDVPQPGPHLTCV